MEALLILMAGGLILFVFGVAVGRRIERIENDICQLKEKAKEQKQPADKNNSKSDIEAKSSQDYYSPNDIDYMGT